MAACDLADRTAVAALLAGVPAAYPLTGVVHAAGVLDDGLLPALTRSGWRRWWPPRPRRPVTCTN